MRTLEGGTHPLILSTFRHMAFAIIKTGGKQYRVSQGDKLNIEKLDAEAGASVTIDQVLFYGNGAELRIGDPVIEGASVQAKIIEHFRGEKVKNFKYKRRKGYHRTVGHRQSLTRIEIESIKA